MSPAASVILLRAAVQAVWVRIFWSWLSLIDRNHTRRPRDSVSGWSRVASISSAHTGCSLRSRPAAMASTISAGSVQVRAPLRQNSWRARWRNRSR